jgi:hypothetical protein
VLDNARALVTEPAGATVDTAAASDAPDVAELPLPDRSRYVGADRLVNLWVGPAGETREIDVWGRRTFSNGPILLVERLGFGEASAYVSAPPEYELVIVGAGAGPDGEALARLADAAAGRQLTTIFTNDDADGTVALSEWSEIGPGGSDAAPAPPPPGLGTVRLVAANLRAYRDALTVSVGGDAFFVGDGTGGCVRQRIEEQGFEPDVLGRLDAVLLDLPPGTTTLTLHSWLSPQRCAGPVAAELSVDVVADASTLVVVYTRDGGSIDSLQLVPSSA